MLTPPGHSRNREEVSSPGFLMAVRMPSGIAARRAFHHMYLNISACGHVIDRALWGQSSGCILG